MCESDIIAKGACGKSATYTLRENGLLFISGQGTASMADYSEKERIKRVWIDEGITELGEHSFYSCVNMTEVNLPNSLTTIGRYSFCKCMQLNALELPKNVTSIEEPAFFCDNHIKLSVSRENKAYYMIDGSLFKTATRELVRYHNTGADTYTVPEGTLAIGEEAFCKNSDLKRIILTDGLKNFNYYCFSSCHNLEDIVFPPTTKRLDEGVIDGCWKLRRIICLAKVPPETAEHASFFNMNCEHHDTDDWYETPLYVPGECVNDYRRNEFWGAFKVIYSIDELDKH